MFVRFQSAVPNRSGAHPGIFALANGLASDERLAVEDREWWTAANARAELLYADPTSVGARVYDHEINPGAASWFRESATELLAMSRGYLDLLDRYAVPWVELRTSTPGQIVYEDDVQVVTVPFKYPNDWPFDSPPPSR